MRPSRTPGLTVLVLTIRRFLNLLALVTISCLSVYSQQRATASLIGTIKDPNNALVQGASMSVKQKATSVNRDTVSDDNGTFVLTNLSAGVYEVRVKASGFAEKVLPYINLQVGQTRDLEIFLRV